MTGEHELYDQWRNAHTLIDCRVIAECEGTNRNCSIQADLHDVLSIKLHIHFFKNIFTNTVTKGVSFVLSIVGKAFLHFI